MILRNIIILMIVFNIMVGALAGLGFAEPIAPQNVFIDQDDPADYLSTGDNVEEVEESHGYSKGVKRGEGIFGGWLRYVYGIPYVVKVGFGLQWFGNALYAVFSFMYLYLFVEFLRGVKLE